MGLSRPIIGVLLAGGGSTRMGTAKHGLRAPCGRTLAEVVADALAPICDEVIVSGPGDVLPQFRHVHDARAGCGPLAGIEAALSSEFGRHYLFVPCDLPFVTTALLARLLVETEAMGTVFRRGDRGTEGRRDEGMEMSQRIERIHALPCRLSADALPHVRRALDDNRLALRDLFINPAPDSVSESLPLRPPVPPSLRAFSLTLLPSPHPASGLLNLNTPSDLAAMQALRRADSTNA